MDYCAKESTFQPECEVKDATIKMDIQETSKILNEMYLVLSEFGSIINGKFSEENKRKDANCLWEEARMMTALAYECLKKLNEIKGNII